MRIDVWLTQNGVFPSRNRAAEAISEGRISVDGKTVRKPSFPVSGAERIDAAPPEHPFVSRAGRKLDAALDAFALDIRGLTAVDLGASTGGFTDCLLRRGAGFVYAVDVGSGQLDASLRNDERVCNLENVNARYLKKEDFPRPIDLAVADVSFISQRLLYPAVASFLPEGKHFVSLIKPQFEVGPSGVGKNGIVRDPDGRLFRRVLNELEAEAAKNGLALRSVADSPIKGGDGNREYLALWYRISQA